MMVGPGFFRMSVERLLRIDPVSKPGVYADLFDAAELNDLNYLLALLLSAGIATLGLVLNSPAVVIGAMLISPLMGPILSAGLALAAADLYLGMKSLMSILGSVLLAVGSSAVLVWLLPFQSPTAEIVARTQPNLLDLGVALFSGLAGSLVVSRGQAAGGLSVLPGAAIAVALMPPLCTVGFGVGSGFGWPIIYGAGLLFLTNLVAIVASAFLVFYLVRMDAPEIRASLDESRVARSSRDPLYRALQRTRFATAFRESHGVRWRTAMLLAVLLVLFVPLRRGLLQVRDETLARAAARDVVRGLVPASGMVSQAVEVGPERVTIRLLVTTPVAAAKISAAERTLMMRTGKEATITVRRIAAEEELAMLRSELSRPVPAPAPPPPPPPPTLDALRTDLMARLETPLKEIWPSEVAALDNYDLVLTADGIVVNVNYRAARDLDGVFAQTVAQYLQRQLGAIAVGVKLHRDRGRFTPPARQKSAGSTAARPGDRLGGRAKETGIRR